MINRKALLAAAFVAAVFQSLNPAQASSTTPPQTIQGRVVSVSDGDTMDVLQEDSLGNKWQVRIRLAGIDAPERNQPFGNKSKQNLARLCFGKRASIIITDTDKYARMIGHASCEGMPANLQMILDGYAWAYREFTPPAAYIKAENGARAARIGLWADNSPTPPWVWRQENKRK